MTWDEVRALALSLPGVEAGTSYGTPGFRVRRKFLCRLHPDGVSLVVGVSLDEREMLMAAEPETFHITEHYRAWPAMLVRFAAVHPPTLKRLLEQTWREAALKKVVMAYDARA